MTVRRMVVVRSPGTETRPEIRISNSWLLLAGFTVGASIEVAYQKNKIIITKIETNHEHNLQKPKRPFSVPTAQASGATAPRESDGHAERGASDTASITQALYGPASPTCFVLGRSGDSINH